MLRQDAKSPRLRAKSVHRFEELDSLRAFAILGVLYTHFINDDSMLGTLGVELFFVLSGYLITGILLRGRSLIEAGESTLPTVLKSFYIRRALRILPVYYLCLFCLWLAGSQEVRDQIWWHATFNSNMLFVFIPFTNLTPHFWTLAVEEQFYIFWPAIILLAPRRHLLTILLAVIAIAPIYRLLAGFFLGFSHNAVGIVTIACLDSLGVGALLAYVENDDCQRGMLLKAGLWSLPVPLFVVLFGTTQNIMLLSTFCALAFAWIIACSMRGPSKRWAFDFLRSRLLVNIGVVSYGAYVFHLAAAGLVHKAYFYAFGQELDRGALLFALGSTLTLVMAMVSWKLFEKPINSLKSYWPYQNGRS
jgi:peptidoglycan/LPS O-acetylase OafA/YrhL